MSSVSLQIFLWVLKDNDLTGMAFIDTQLHIHQMFSIKNFILAADLMKSISLLRYQEESKTLSLVSRVSDSHCGCRHTDKTLLIEFRATSRSKCCIQEQRQIN